MDRTEPPAPPRAVPRPPPPAGPPARLVGRYELADRIGLGAMGSVWRAWDHQSGRWVGAKVLDQTTAAGDAGMLLRFVREQSVRVAHPHVVTPTGWAAEDHLVVLTMDLVRGGSLDDLLAEHGPLPESYVRVLLAQLLRALAAVHEAGVVHRDVKPANLLLEPTGGARPHLRLGDFGVATLLHEPRLTRHPGAVGTDGYMAPEQRRGALPDPRQDLYAAGVVALQLLTGRTPTPQGPPALPALPAAPDPRLGDLTGLLTALTSPDPAHRPPTALAALERLHRLGVPPGTPWDELPRPPHVPDRLGEPAPPRSSRSAGPHRARTTLAALCLASASALCLVALGLLLTG